METFEEATPVFAYTSPLSALTRQAALRRMSTASSSGVRPPPAAAWKEASEISSVSSSSVSGGVSSISSDVSSSSSFGSSRSFNSSSFNSSIGIFGSNISSSGRMGVSGSTGVAAGASRLPAPDPFPVSSSVLRIFRPLSCFSPAVASAFPSPAASPVTSSPPLSGDDSTPTSRFCAAPSHSSTAGTPCLAAAAATIEKSTPLPAGAAALLCSTADYGSFSSAAAAASAPLSSTTCTAAAGPPPAAAASINSDGFLPLRNLAAYNVPPAVHTVSPPSPPSFRISGEEKDRPRDPAAKSSISATASKPGDVQEKISFAGCAPPEGTAVAEETPLRSPKEDNEREEEQQQAQPMSFYEVLGISPQASADEIRRVYYALCRVYHPDKCATASGACAAKLHALQQAYNVLADECRRLVYDIQLGFYEGAEKRKRVAQLYRLQRERTRRDVEYMRAEYRAKVQYERSVNGLLIRKAWYGNLELRRSLKSRNYVGPVTETCLEGPFLDVTVPLQCHVDNSRFAFSGGADCSMDQLKGFHNPALCTPNEDTVCLYVLYDFQGMIHEATARHQCPFAMPLKRHRVSPALGPFGPYAPSNVSSAWWIDSAIPRPPKHVGKPPPASGTQAAEECRLLLASNETLNDAVFSTPLQGTATSSVETLYGAPPTYMWSLETTSSARGFVSWPRPFWLITLQTAEVPQRQLRSFGRFTQGDELTTPHEHRTLGGVLLRTPRSLRTWDGAEKSY